MAPNPAPCRSNPVTWRRSLTNAALAIAMGLTLSGCLVVPLPIPVGESKPLPDIASHVPAKDKTGARPILVFTKKAVKKEGFARSSTIEARFVEGRDLSAFQNEQALYSGQGIPLFLMGGNVGFAISELHLVQEELEKLCLVTPSGYVLTFVPRFESSTTVIPSSDFQWEPLHANRRDAVIAALRTGSETPFDETDGPCGIRGKLALGHETRDQVISYLTLLPTIEPGGTRPRLANIIRRAKKNAVKAGQGGAMVLVDVRWRDQQLAEPPMYLSTADTRSFRELVHPLTASEIVALLPLYSEGKRALEKISIEHLCVIQSDGSAGWWSKEEDAFELLGVRAQNPTWRKKAIAALKGSRNYQACAPIHPEDWSDAELRGAISFVEDLPVAVPTKGVSSIRLAADATEAEALVLVIANTNQKHDVIPLLVSRGDNNAGAFLSWILSLQPQAVLKALHANDREVVLSTLDYLCLITADGRFVELSYEASRPDDWNRPKYSRVTPEFKDDAINALKDGKSDYHGSYVCALERTAWPVDTRADIVTFLKRIHVEGKLVTSAVRE